MKKYLLSETDIAELINEISQTVASKLVDKETQNFKEENIDDLIQLLNIMRGKKKEVNTDEQTDIPNETTDIVEEVVVEQPEVVSPAVESVEKV